MELKLHVCAHEAGLLALGVKSRAGLKVCEKVTETMCPDFLQYVERLYKIKAKQSVLCHNKVSEN